MKKEVAVNLPSKSGASDKTKVLLRIQVPPRVKRAYEEMAKSRGLEVGEVVDEAFREFLAKQNSPRANGGGQVSDKTKAQTYTITTGPGDDAEEVITASDGRGDRMLLKDPISGFWERHRGRYRPLSEREALLWCVRFLIPEWPKSLQANFYSALLAKKAAKPVNEAIHHGGAE
jgi:hypothetical protein